MEIETDLVWSKWNLWWCKKKIKCCWHWTTDVWTVLQGICCCAVTFVLSRWFLLEYKTKRVLCDCMCPLFCVVLLCWIADFHQNLDILLTIHNLKHRYSGLDRFYCGHLSRCTNVTWVVSMIIYLWPIFAINCCHGYS